MLERWFEETCARRMRPGRTFVTLTYAQTLDGSITHRRGEPGLAISGPETKRMTHWLRTRHDGILVGVGTVLADDPRLSVTHAEGPSPRPVVLDSRLRTPPEARLLRHPLPALILCRAEAAESGRADTLRSAGATVLPVDAAGEGLDLTCALEALPALGIGSLMVEGGARVITACLADRLADIAIITLAPFFAGGVNAVSAPLPGLPRLHATGSAQRGEDWVIWGEFGRAE